MTKLGEWIKVDATSLPADDVEVAEGVEIRVGLSPYDIPEAVRGNVDPNTGTFTIELKYLSERHEPTEMTRLDDSVSFETGVLSQSLHKIHVNLMSIGCENVTVKLVSKLQKRLSRYNTDLFPKKRQTQLKAAEKTMAKYLAHA